MFDPAALLLYCQFQFITGGDNNVGVESWDGTIICLLHTGWEGKEGFPHKTISEFPEKTPCTKMHMQMLSLSRTAARAEQVRLQHLLTAVCMVMH